MCGSEAGNALYLTKEVVDDVAPVAQHIDDHTTAIFLAVVPRWALCRDCVALEDPVAELTANGEDVAEEIVFNEALELNHTGEPELVLNDTVFHASVAADLVELVSVFGFDRSRLFAVDVLASSSCCLNRVEAAECGLRVEIDRVGRISHHAIEISRVFLDAGLLD